MVGFALSISEVEHSRNVLSFTILHLQLTIKISKCLMIVLMEIKLMKHVT